MVIINLARKGNLQWHTDLRKFKSHSKQSLKGAIIINVELNYILLKSVCADQSIWHSCGSTGGEHSWSKHFFCCNKHNIGAKINIYVHRTTKWLMSFMFEAVHDHLYKQLLEKSNPCQWNNRNMSILTKITINILITFFDFSF